MAGQWGPVGPLVVSGGGRAGVDDFSPGLLGAKIFIKLRLPPVESEAYAKDGGTGVSAPHTGYFTRGEFASAGLVSSACILPSSSA